MAGFQSQNSPTDSSDEPKFLSSKAALSEVVKRHPWTFALPLLLVSNRVNSQATAITAMVPLGLAIGVPPGDVMAFAAACGALLHPAHLPQ